MVYAVLYCRWAMRPSGGLMKRLFGITVMMAALSVSCTMWDTVDYEGALKGVALMTAIAENEENTLSRATLPLWLGGALADGIDVSGLAENGYLTGSLANYPEKLQTTNYRVTNKGNSLYFIQTVTTYPGNSIRETTYEDYYLKDNDSKLTNDDPVCDAKGKENPLYREKFETRFVLLGYRGYRITSLRSEIITNTSDSDSPVHYASFKDVDLSSLRNLESSLYTPQENASAQYSSKVAYTQSFSAGDAATIGLEYYLGRATAVRVSGTRYYTEIKTGDTTECSALYIEDFTDDSSALIARAVSKYYYTIDGSGKRSNKTVVGTSVFKTKNGNKVMDL
mgnify:CR=1 FL=1